MAAASSASAFVGRTPELTQLTDALSGIRSRVTSAIFVLGEPGVGKTRLLAEFAEIARADGIGVMTGAALDGSEDTAFWPVLDALNSLFRDPANDWAIEATRPWGHELSRLLPGVRALADPASGTQAEVGPTLDLLFRVILGIAADRPTVVLLDDMHQTDQSTRALLAHLMATLTDEPLLFVVAYRHEDFSEPARIHQLGIDLERGRRAATMTLSGLGRAAVDELLADEDPGMAELVWRRSGGNALLVEEISRAMRSQPEWIAAVPHSIRDVMRLRLRSLPKQARTLVRTIALGEEPVSHQLLAKVIAGPTSDLLSALRTAVESGMVTIDATEGGYRLRHGLMREVVASDLLPGDRLFLHRRYAKALERRSHLDDRMMRALAGHWLGAEKWDKALSAFSAAAEVAETAHGYHEAKEHWGRALALSAKVPIDDLRLSTLRERAAQAAHLSGDHVMALATLDKRLTAHPSDSGARAAGLQSRMGQYLAAAGKTAEATRSHARAVSLLDSATAPEDCVAVIAGYAEALASVGQYRESRRQASTALELAGRNGLRDLEARLLPTIAQCLAYLEDSEAAWAAAKAGVESAVIGGQPEVIATAHLRLVELLCGPLNKLHAGVEAGRQAADEINALGLSRTYGVALQSSLANALFRSGDWQAADDLVQEALKAQPTGSAGFGLRLSRCRLLLGRGELEAAKEDLDLLQALGSQTAGPLYQLPLLTLRAGLHLWQGRPDLAREQVRLGLAVADQSPEDVWSVAPLVWHGLRAEAEAAELGRLHGRSVDTMAVDAMHARMTALSREGPGPSGVRKALVGYQQLCDGEASRAHGASDTDCWRQASTTWDANGHPYPAAYARFRLAESLFARSARSGEAAEVLRMAYISGCRLGANPLLDDIRALAARASVRLPDESGLDRNRSSPAAPGLRSEGPRPADDEAILTNLTPREREVLHELGRGCSNQQIARRLFISEKTVSVHVSRILAKLGVRSRVQAAMLTHHHPMPVERLEPITTTDPRRDHG